MNNLEEYIKANRVDFDHKEPREKLWSRIESDLDKDPRNFGWSRLTLRLRDRKRTLS